MPWRRGRARGGRRQQQIFCYVDGFCSWFVCGVCRYVLALRRLLLLSAGVQLEGRGNPVGERGLSFSKPCAAGDFSCKLFADLEFWRWPRADGVAVRGDSLAAPVYNLGSRPPTRTLITDTFFCVIGDLVALRSNG